MSLLYHQPLTPEQVRRERLIGLVLAAVATLLIIWVWTNDRGEPARGEKEEGVVEMGQDSPSLRVHLRSVPPYPLRSQEGS